MILTKLSNTLRDEGIIDGRESFIDATFAVPKGGGDAVWATKHDKGVKIHGDDGSPWVPALGKLPCSQSS